MRDGLLDIDGGDLDRIRVHNSAAVWFVGGFGDAEVVVVAEGEHLELVEASSSISRCLQDHRRSRVADGEAGHARVQVAFDLLLRCLRQVRDILAADHQGAPDQSEEHTSNSSHPSISYAVFCLKKKKKVISKLLYEIERRRKSQQTQSNQTK